MIIEMDGIEGNLICSALRCYQRKIKESNQKFEHIGEVDQLAALFNLITKRQKIALLIVE